ncbi:hypothetical protein AV530_015897 [Patagioenas fasciata monilis]|uniref:Uncharacterized protein n=1 Tax=Patagioenas fasciata monilis TaxID=372326 RepID=A0A1V4KJ41_PATFA|nr:hypothetical protein AV530_015897 [Patagioenas fasciata monilis]
MVTCRAEGRARIRLESPASSTSWKEPSAAKLPVLRTSFYGLTITKDSWKTTSASLHHCSGSPESGFLQNPSPVHC